MIIVYRFYYVYDNINSPPYVSPNMTLSLTQYPHFFTFYSSDFQIFYFLHVRKMSKLTSVKINSIERHSKGGKMKIEADFVFSFHS